MYVLSLLEKNVMEPVITTIAAAVALGAAAALKDTASKAVVDAYAGLKTLIQDRYKKNKDVTDAVDYLVKKPKAEGRRQELSKALQYAGANKDAELVQAAEAVLAAVKKQPGGEDAVRQIINQQVIGSGNIFSGTGNVTVIR
ncbi:MAG: hypothetical protein D3925_20415 [Candidatus Electrothrix sp. AR5]|nr:hypothetical protein [Candidatus Electrothrix sp. AR5]